MNTLVLIQFSETEKRFAIALVIVALLAVVLIGLIGSIIIRVMKWQSRKMDTLVHDVVITRVITTGRSLTRYGRKKNWRCFFKQAWIPFLIILASTSFILIYESCVGWNYNPFSVENGFGSIFFTWNYVEGQYVDWGFLAWKKITCTHYPTFVKEAWAGYVFATLILFSGSWYLVTVQCLISRTIKLFFLSKKLDEKSLDNFFNQQNPNSPTNNVNNLNNNYPNQNPNYPNQNQVNQNNGNNFPPIPPQSR